MKLVVPFIGELSGVDARLIRLAEFLGISCTPLSLPKLEGPCADCLGEAVRDHQSCFVVNPSVLQEWIGEDTPPSDLVSFFEERFPHLLVHALRPKPFDSKLIEALSGGSLLSVREVERGGQSYDISSGSKDVCEVFAGLSFGPANLANDQTLAPGPHVSALRPLISIEGRPFMASLKRGDSEIWFLAGKDVADLNTQIGESFLSTYFSRFLPHAMILRHIFGDESWRPCGQYASVIIDDPLLRRDYGFLNYEFLLRLMKQHNFQTTVAFIPHNFRRSSPQIAQMFRENAERFALCFHGNDHTGGEFASTDTALLNTMLQVAEQRIEVHHRITGVPCDRVMVFPQGRFSVEAMSVLKSRNFDCAVNTTPHPLQCDVRLTLEEMTQPALLRFGGLPLFLRKDSLRTQSVDIAFNLFFGKPVLIVEHHGIFQHPEFLVDAVSRINAIAPGIRWTNLAAATSNSILKRTALDGTYNIQAYSSTVLVSNDAEIPKRTLIEWKHPSQGVPVEGVVQDGVASADFAATDAGVRFSIDLPPRSSQAFSLIHRNPYLSLATLGLRRKTAAFLRRRLSELRDNHLSKSPQALAAVKILVGRARHSES